MKKRGFTLVELLAVIVILGLLIGIITPVVTGILSSSEEDAYNSQVDNLIKAAKTWSLQYTDDLPNNGSDIICKAVTELSIQEYYKETNYEEDNYFGYYAVKEQTGVLASAGAPYALGVEYTCDLGDGNRTFYVLEENDNTVSLIMNMNIDTNGKGTTNGGTVGWCKNDSDNSCDADGARAHLKISTINWTKLSESQISLPTYDQIYKAAGNLYYNLPPWLYENLNGYGYWTSTPRESYSYYAWSVVNTGGLESDNIDINSHYGVRPVITIPKSKISSGLSIDEFNTIYLSLDRLVTDGIIEDDEVIDPRTNDKMEGCIAIKYVEEYKQYEYKFISDNNLCK